jgi:hypothetical protein
MQWGMIFSANTTGGVSRPGISDDLKYISRNDVPRATDSDKKKAENPKIFRPQTN